VRAGRLVLHAGAGLGQEVLHDHLLHVTVHEVRGSDRLERGDAVFTGFADADEDAGGERHTGPTCCFQRRQPSLGGLVGSAAVAGQVAAQRLDHHSLAGRHLGEQAQLGLVERAGVGVGQQPGLVEHQLGHRMHVGNGALVAVLAQPRPGHLVALLRCLTQREERLVAPHASPILGNAQHLLGREVRRLQAGRRLSERAVAALVAAEHGERNEHLRRVRDACAVGVVAHNPRPRQQLVERGGEQFLRHRGTIYEVSAKTEPGPPSLRPSHALRKGGRMRGG